MRQATGTHRGLPGKARRTIPARLPSRSQPASDESLNPEQRGGTRTGAIPMTAAAATQRQVQLSPDELAVLAQIADGLTQHSAARRLDISARTVRRRLRTICARLHVCEPIEAVVWAAKRGLL